MTIRTRSELRRAIRDAETTAALLRQPGAVLHGRGARERIADLLDALAGVCRRAFDPDAEVPSPRVSSEIAAAGLFDEDAA